MGFGSYCTYSKKINDSGWFLQLFILCGICYSITWWYGCSKLPNVKDKFFLSMAVDVLMIVAYYIIPMLLNSKHFNVSSIFFSLITLIGILGFKFSCGE